MGGGPNSSSAPVSLLGSLLGFSPMADRLWVLSLALVARGTAGTTTNMGVPRSRRPHMGVHRSSDLSHWVTAHPPTGPFLGCVPHSPGSTLKPGCGTISSRSLPGLDWELE